MFLDRTAHVDVQLTFHDLRRLDNQCGIEAAFSYGYLGPPAYNKHLPAPV